MFYRKVGWNDTNPGKRCQNCGKSDQPLVNSDYIPTVGYVYNFYRLICQDCARRIEEQKRRPLPLHYSRL